jgi:hypothetical protein
MGPSASRKSVVIYLHCTLLISIACKRYHRYLCIFRIARDASVTRLGSSRPAKPEAVRLFRRRQPSSHQRLLTPAPRLHHLTSTTQRTHSSSPSQTTDLLLTPMLSPVTFGTFILVAIFGLAGLHSILTW